MDYTTIVTKNDSRLLKGLVFNSSKLQWLGNN